MPKLQSLKIAGNQLKTESIATFDIMFNDLKSQIINYTSEIHVLAFLRLLGCMEDIPARRLLHQIVSITNIVKLSLQYSQCKPPLILKEVSSFFIFFKISKL